MQLKITPRRRWRFLDPKNINAFVRRDTAAAPVPLDLIVDRYLEDTRADLLRREGQSMAALRWGIVAAMPHTWVTSTASSAPAWKRIIFLQIPMTDTGMP